MPEPTVALQALRASTADLLKGLDDAQWSDDDLRTASLCEGWTRGHVLTHLARNADGIAATLAGVLRGEIVPRYPGGSDARDAAIAQGAARPVVEVVADLTESSERLDRIFGAVSEADAWDATTDGGTAGDWPFRRLEEVEVHRVDLAGTYGPDRWPPMLVGELLPQLADEIADRTDRSFRIVVDAPATVPTLAGRSWTIGSREPIEVRGPDWALLAWLAGRGQAVTSVLGELPRPAPRA